MHYQQSDLILEEVRQALISDPHFEFKRSGSSLRHGICPNCGERECFVNLEKPWRISCGRLNNCQWSSTVRELYPEIFENLSKRHPATEQNPNATADAYMSEIRGFKLDVIRSMYMQGNAKNQKREEYYPAVKIIISQTCYWLRIINAEDVRRNGDKAKIIGDYRNFGWVPPGMTFSEGDEIWITEGIFKSMAFLHINKKSISGLSASNLPLDIIKANAGKNITWILAEDNDSAGRDYTVKFKKIIEELGERVAVAFPAVGEDWDDVFRDGRLNQQYFNDSFFRGFYYLADSYQRKSFYHYCRYQYTHSVIDFQYSLYRYKIDDKKYQNDQENNFKYPDPEVGWNIPQEKIDEYFSKFNSFVDIKKICPCKPEFLYIEKDIITTERTNTFYVQFANKTPSMLLTSDGTIYKSADNFSNGLLKHTGFAPFTGSNNDLAILHERWFNKRIKFVRGVPFAGYEPDTQIYVFPDFAYHKGQYQKVNKHGFFSFSRNSVKCNLSGLVFRKTTGDFNPQWLRNFYEAFNLNGMVLLSWWMGTLFSEQIRKKQDSWPFLEYTGAPGAGKSTQLRFLWRCLGVEGYEGFDPNKTTLAGRARQMTQLSNMPVVLLEADRNDAGRKNIKSFDFSELKNLFNGGVIRTTGVKTAGSEVRQLDFRGGILISQNAEVDGEPAILERIVHCHCTKDHFNEVNAAFANQLRDMSASELGSFLHAVLRNERRLLDGYFRTFESCYKRFSERDNGQVNNWRIILNHAQIAAWLYQLPVVFGSGVLSHEQLNAVEGHIWSRAISRQQRLSGDHPLIEQFWEVYEYLNTKTSGFEIQELLNHSADNKLIAINMPHFQEVAASHRQNIASTPELLPLFKSCKRYPCLGLKSVRSNILNKTMKCWTFRRNKDDEAG